jgi:hypothetical protein
MVREVAKARGMEQRARRGHGSGRELASRQPWWRRSVRAPSRAGRGQGASERARVRESGALPLPKMRARKQSMW